jgi:hypothetical protein
MFKNIVKNLSNLPGWRTDRKIVVIESDDWGSIRMSSKDAYSKLLKAGLTLEKGAGARYNKYDTLASKTDLSFLFETLNSVKDKNDHSAKITALSLSANPDFYKIKENGFQKYYYESFFKTLERYNIDSTKMLWQEGYDANIFVPEFHGREHLNTFAWMRALQAGDKEALVAFEYGIWGYNRKAGIGFQAAFDLEYFTDLQRQKDVIKDGLRLFKELHGHAARFFVPPNGPLNNQLEVVASDEGIVYMSSSKIQNEPLGNGKTKKYFRYLGKQNENKQTYITRNAFFEPSGSTRNEIDGCLSEIELAFKWKKPAVISSHRVNYVGGLNEANRDSSLVQLKDLLQNIKKRWPNVEFMTSSELGDIITKRQFENVK